MKHFVRHLIYDGMLPSITRKSFLNCHVYGLHSLMLVDTPEKTIRLFYASPHHELWRNEVSTVKEMSLGFHNHHCNLSLEVYSGKITNWQVELAEEETKRIPMSLKKHEYSSYINQGKGGFTLVGESKLVTSSIKNLTSKLIGDSIFMKADSLHTVFVEKGQEATWFVYEGLENRDHKPVCYSNTDLSTHSTENLYKRPQEEDVFDILERCKLL